MKTWRPGTISGPFDGVLAEPVTDVPIGNERAYFREAFRERERALLRHYGIEEEDPNRWYLGFRFLAADFVRGFQIEPSRGSRRIWSDAMIFIAMTKAKHDGHSLRRTALRLEYCDRGVGALGSAGYIRKRYYEILKDERALLGALRAMQHMLHWAERPSVSIAISRAEHEAGEACATDPSRWVIELLHRLDTILGSESPARPVLQAVIEEATAQRATITKDIANPREHK